MGGLGTEKTNTNKTENTNQNYGANSSSAPWQLQVPYLSKAFQTASGQLDQGTGNVYGGDINAQFTPEQLATFRNMIGAGGAAGTLATNGAGSISGAANALENYTPQGGVDSNIHAAGQYADNPFMSGMVDAAMRDARRSVSEDVLPGIDRGAALTGNLDSSTRGISHGIVERGLADKTADVSAGLRGDAFNRGLSLAEQGRQFDNSSVLQALQQRGSLGATALSGAGSLFDMGSQGGAGVQQAAQAALDNARAKAEYASDRPSDLLARYFGIVGGSGYGGTQTSNGFQNGTKLTNGKEEKEASPAAVIGGLLGAVSKFIPGKPG